MFTSDKLIKIIKRQISIITYYITCSLYLEIDYVKIISCRNSKHRDNIEGFVYNALCNKTTNNCHTNRFESSPSI